MAGNTISAISIAFGLDARGFDNGLKGVTGQLGGLQAGIMGAMSFATAAVGWDLWAIKLAAGTETANAQFSVLLGSADKAKTLLKDLKDFAATNPLTFSGVQENAKVLLSFGMAGEEIMPTIKMLGDISGGSSDRMKMLTLAFAQMNAAGRLMGQDLLQMVNAGFNPLQVISEKTGLTMGELKKKMEAGAISADIVKEAFQAATAEGGLFHGLLAKLGITAEGNWAKLVDSFETLGREFGEKILPDIVEGLKALTDAIKMIGDSGVLSIALAIGKVFNWPLYAAKSAYQWISGTTEDIKAAKEEVKKFNYETSKMKELGKQAEEAFEWMKKDLKDLTSKGTSVTDSVATPIEKYIAEISELNELLDEGYISWETYNRAIAKSAEEMTAATKAKNELNALGYQGVGAVERYTTAGFSAVQSGMEIGRQQQEISERQLAEAKEQTRVQKEMSEALRNAGVKVQEVSI